MIHSNDLLAPMLLLPTNLHSVSGLKFIYVGLPHTAKLPKTTKSRTYNFNNIPSCMREILNSINPEQIEDALFNAAFFLLLS